MQIVGKRCLYLTRKRYTLYNLWHCTIIHWLCSLGHWRGIKAYRMDHMALPLRGDWSMLILKVYVTFDALNLYHFAVFSLYFWKQYTYTKFYSKITSKLWQGLPQERLRSESDQNKISNDQINFLQTAFLSFCKD